MPLSPLDSDLFNPLFGDAELAGIFSDAAYLHALLTVEAALATVQARLDIIPDEAAQAIAEGAVSLEIDLPALQRDLDLAGVPIIGLVKQLRAHVGGEAANFVHWGATTQDILDTATVLQCQAALARLEAVLHPLIAQLADLAEGHRHTLMAGRTHSQQALPITFGLKVANWLAPLVRHRERLAELKSRLLMVQLGGAAGTLAPFGERGPELQAALAAELGLAVPLVPWHTQRDNVAELAHWLSLVTGSLAKMAQDIILLAQTEIGELCETDDPTRGGSSTMPQKSNPIISELILAAARTNASHLSAMHHALIQEQERGTHGWQVEWLNLPPMFGLTLTALKKAQFLSENLVVDVARMQANVDASQGLMLAEAISFALAEHMPRAEAKKLIKQACEQAITEDRHLIEVMQEQTDVPVAWEALSERNYLGASDIFITRVILEARRDDV